MTLGNSATRSTVRHGFRRRTCARDEAARIATRRSARIPANTVGTRLLRAAEATRDLVAELGRTWRSRHDRDRPQLDPSSPASTASSRQHRRRARDHFAGARLPAELTRAHLVVLPVATTPIFVPRPAPAPVIRSIARSRRGRTPSPPWSAPAAAAAVTIGCCAPAAPALGARIALARAGRSRRGSRGRPPRGNRPYDVSRGAVGAESVGLGGWRISTRRRGRCRCAVAALRYGDCAKRFSPPAPARRRR